MMNAPFQGFASFEARTEDGRRPEAQAAGALLLDPYRIRWNHLIRTIRVYLHILRARPEGSTGIHLNLTGSRG